jgi:hypothetical protein
MRGDYTADVSTTVLLFALNSLLERLSQESPMSRVFAELLQTALPLDYCTHAVLVYILVFSTHSQVISIFPAVFFKNKAYLCLVGTLSTS